MQFTLLNIVLFLLTRAFTAFSLTNGPKNSSDQFSISRQVWRMHLYLVQIWPNSCLLQTHAGATDTTSLRIRHSASALETDRASLLPKMALGNIAIHTSSLPSTQDTRDTFTGGTGACHSAGKSIHGWLPNWKQRHCGGQGTAEGQDHMRKRFFPSVSSSTVTETALKDIAGAALRLVTLHLSLLCSIPQDTLAFLLISHSPSKLLRASGTLLEFGWDESRPTMAFPQPCLQQLPGTELGTIAEPSRTRSAAARASTSAHPRSRLCSALQTLPAPPSACLGCLCALVAEGTSGKWSPREPNCMYSSTSHKDSNHWRPML